MLIFTDRETISLKIIINIKLIINFILKQCIKRYQILIKKKKLFNLITIINKTKTVIITY